ncbi:hypothetical protein AVEN_200332-1 [Araneus ventricosus]|uniref:Uncharacterized protein n=1 Tax=Araneus ventricosus TaxID=182803 RepID=A0A4Y2VGB5_ARAVE|nr:hypothetical protein AVEN_163180-1 [Araneus ventricosus]GBO23634.1 hypothetical protein AVEN_235708-1 [Araneus ventricosus]GBO23635.1 hypothetical protein AVEN_271279-1 [Araneus ventricosus]GBO23641.1 hypothetical protein AVEN_200332-1 [Araneus ventricosus]
MYEYMSRLYAFTKKATLEGITIQYPAPSSFLRKKLHDVISTQLWQNEWDCHSLIATRVGVQMAVTHRQLLLIRMHRGGTQEVIPALTNSFIKMLQRL